jgi:hypothetical protein
LDDYEAAAREVEAAQTLEQLEAIAAALGLANARDPQALLLRGLIEFRRSALSGGARADGDSAEHDS